MADALDVDVSDEKFLYPYGLRVTPQFDVLSEKSFVYQNPDLTISPLRVARLGQAQAGVDPNQYVQNSGLIAVFVASTGTVSTVIDGVLSSGAFRSSIEGTTFSNVFAGRAKNFVFGRDIMFRLSSSENVFSVSSNAATAMTDEGNTNTDFPRSIDACWTAQERMLAITDLQTGSYVRDGVWYSASQDPQTWDRASNFVRIGRSGFSPRAQNTGICELEKDQIIVFKENEIYELDISNPSTAAWRARLLVSGVGTMYNSNFGRTYCQIGHDVFFSTPDMKIYSLRSILSSPTFPRPISDDVASDIDGDGTPLKLYGFRDRLFVVQFNDDYTTMVYHLPTGRWSTYTSKISSMAQFTGTTIRAHVSHNTVATNAGSLVDIDSGTSDYNPVRAISLQEVSKLITFGQIGRFKRPQALDLIAVATGTSYTISIEYQIDESGTWTTLTGSPLTVNASDGVLVRTTLSMLGVVRFKTLRLRITASSSTTTPRIVGWIVYSYLEEVELS